MNDRLLKKLILKEIHSVLSEAHPGTKKAVEKYLEPGYEEETFKNNFKQFDVSQSIRNAGPVIWENRCFWGRDKLNEPIAR